MKVTFSGDNHCLLWDVGRLWSRVRWAAESCRDVLLEASGFQTALRQGDSWAGTEPVWLCWLCPGVQISRYLFAETPEGGKSRNILPR